MGPRSTVGYIRISTLEQADRLTLETQELAIRKTCKTRGWALRMKRPFFIDKAEHSDDLKRKELSKLLREVEAKKIERIVCYMHDRLARGELLTALLQFLHANGIRVFFLDLPELDDNTEMLYDNIASQGKYFLKMLRKRTAAGVKTALDKGHRVGRPPCGFTVKDKTEWVPRKYALEIAQLHRDGMSPLAIRDLRFKYPAGRRKGKSITLTHVKCVISRIQLWRDGELVAYLLERQKPRREEFHRLLEERGKMRRDAIIELQRRTPVAIGRRSL